MYVRQCVQNCGQEGVVAEGSRRWTAPGGRRRRPAGKSKRVSVRFKVSP
jgi:hypothetical protein